jgi:hypothetical protein
MGHTKQKEMIIRIVDDSAELVVAKSLQIELLQLQDGGVLENIIDPGVEIKEELEDGEGTEKA